MMYKLKCLKLFLTTWNDLYFKYFLITKGATANHAQELGFRTIFLEDCSRGIDPNDIKDTLDGVRSNHGVVISSSEVSKVLWSTLHKQICDFLLISSKHCSVIRQHWSLRKEIWFWIAIYVILIIYLFIFINLSKTNWF